jgi:hypothetical protein
MLVNLKDYYFPVSESKKIIIPKSNDLIDPENYLEMAYTLEGYKAILREDTGDVISIKSSDYELVSNQDVIETALEEIDKTGLKYHFNEVYSFCDSNKMKLAVEFPDIQFDETDKSDDKKTNFCVFVHNSYDGSSAINVMFGGIRIICINGQIFKRVLESINVRHQGFIFLSRLQDKINEAIERIPEIQSRITEMESEQVQDVKLYEKIEKEIGKKAAESVAPTKEQILGMQMWAVYNLLTRYAGHHISKRQATQKQIAISKMFNL